MRGQLGASALEYALLAVVVGIVIWGGLNLFGTQIANFLNALGGAVEQAGQQVQFDFNP